MLLLVTILLVVVAAVTLLIGIVSDNLALIFISIGASALAAIVLAVLSQVTKRKGREEVPAASSTLPVRPDAPVTAASGTSIGEPSEHDVMAEEPAFSFAEARGEGDAPLPIAGYGTLRVNDLLPKLEGLDLDELEAVAQYEEANKNRTTILARIDQLMDELEAAELAPSATALDPEVAEEAAASIAEIGEPVVSIDAGEPDDDEVGRVPLPIESYDELSEDELIPMLADLDADELELVADHEEAGKNRDAVLDAIDDRLDILEGVAVAPAAPVPVEAAAAPAKKASTKKAPARKLPAAAKRAATKAATKRTPAKKAAATRAKAPARTTAKKAAATTAKAPARTAAKKAAATTAKAPARTAAKKAVEPAKKAPSARKQSATTKRASASGTAKKAAVKKVSAAKKAAR